MFLKNILLIIGCFIFLNANSQSGEINLLDKINPQNPSATFQKNMSNSVYPIAAVIPIGILTTGYIKNNKNLQKKGWQSFGSVAINSCLTVLLKQATNRIRPYDVYPSLIFPYKKENDPSFPSGHTSTAFATAASLSINFKEWYITAPAYIWAGSVAYSRLYLGVHYPSDVLAGAVIGVGSAYLSNWLTSIYFHKKEKHRVSVR